MKALSLVFSIFFFVQLNAQVRNLPIDSVEMLLEVSASNVSDNQVVATMNNPTSGFNSFGTCVLTQFDVLGNEGWSLSLEGLSIVSSIVHSDLGIYVAGHAAEQIDLDGHMLDSNAAFVFKLDQLGAVLWARSFDSLNGRETQLLDAGKLIMSSVGLTMVESYLMEVNRTSGVIDYTKDISGVIVADLTRDEVNSVYLTGMAVQSTIIDTVHVIPNMAYPNCIMKFDSDLTARWVRFTPYVTFDFHQEIEKIYRRIAVWHRVQAGNDILSQIRTYDTAGTFIDSVLLPHANFVPHAELASDGFNLFALSEKSLFPANSFPDTLQWYEFDFDLNPHLVREITSDIAYTYNEINGFELVNGLCHRQAYVLYDSDSLTFDSLSLSSSVPGWEVAQLIQETHCDSIVPSAPEVEGAGLGLHVYPNPSEGWITVEGDGLNGELLVYDLSGRVLLRSTFSERTRIRLNPGVYLVSLTTMNGVRTRKVAVR